MEERRRGHFKGQSSDGGDVPTAETIKKGDKILKRQKKPDKDIVLHLKRGLRKLRKREYKGAAKYLELAWHSTRPALLIEDVEQERLAELAAAEVRRDTKQTCEKESNAVASNAVKLPPLR